MAKSKLKLETKFAWKPQPGTQLKAIQATWCEELFFGGARGGGKSDYLLGDFAQDVNVYGQYWRGIIFRKTYKELEELISRSKQIYSLMGAIWKAGDKIWIFPSGATLKMRSMDNEQDADQYQGHQYSWIGFDELPNWPTDVNYNKLKACLRNGDAYVEFKRIRASGNPGGVGHGWVKERFIDPNPFGLEPLDEINYINISTGVSISEKYATFHINHPDWQKFPSTRMFIPSKLQDNAILMKRDPLYVARLAQSGSAALVKAWLAGDWNAIEGAYFDSFDKEKHIVESFMIPNDWFKIRAFDWGFSKPFCVLWGAISDGSIINIGGRKIVFPRDSIIIYREYYGCTGKANEGLKINADEIAKEVKQMQFGEKINDQVADPAIFDVSVGVSIAEQGAKEGIYYRPADNKRIPGWQQIRYRLRGFENKPLIYFMEDCKNLIRTLPVMQYDSSKPEDLDTDSEDHAPDTLRYLCMSRPLTIEIEKTLLEVGEQWIKDFNPHNVRKGLINKKLKNQYE